MSMPRRPLMNSLTPLHNRLPGAGQALWWPLHGALGSAIDDVVGLDEILVAGSASGANWSTPGFYTFPVDNGSTNQIALNASHVDDDTDYLNDVVGLDTAVGGEHLIVCCELSYIEQADTDGYIWFYGMNGTKGGHGLFIGADEIPAFTARGIGGSTSTATNLSAVSGQTFAAMKAQGRFHAVTSIKMLDALTAEVELHIGHAGVGSGVYSSAAITWAAGGATAAAGRNGEEAADVMGFTLGARNTAASSHDRFWGRGATNTGMIGSACAVKFSSYSADRAADTLAELLTHPLDFPSTLLG